MPGSGSPSSYRCGRSPTKRARRSEGGSLTPLKNIDDPRQRSRIDAVVNDHATPARQHNLHPARRLNRARRGWRVLRGLNTFRERRPTAGRRLAADHCLRKHRAIVDLDKTPLSGQTAPREQLARRQSIPPRRRRYLPPPIVALAHDPALLFQRPTTPGTSLDHLKSRHLRHSRMISHTPMSSPGDKDGFRIAPMNPDAYARMLAKIAHAYAVAELGESAFWPKLRRFIRGRPMKALQWIGGDLAVPKPEHRLHDIQWRIQRTGPTNYLVVSLRLFSFIGSPQYHVVVGELARPLDQLPFLEQPLYTIDIQAPVPIPKLVPIEDRLGGTWN